MKRSIFITSVCVVIGFLPTIQGAIVYVPDADIPESHAYIVNDESTIRLVFDSSDLWHFQGGGSSTPYGFAVESEESRAAMNLGESFAIDETIHWTEGSGRLPLLLAGADGEGNFYNSEGFLGIRRFVDDPLPHYGWLRISHDAADNSLVIHDWAWNTTPGEPIQAGAIPEPAAYAAIIGVGALVVVFLRRRRFSLRNPGTRRRLS